MRIFTDKESLLERILTDCIDPETGEFNEEEYAARVSALEMKQAESVEEFALSLQELVADIAALKAKEDELARRRKVLENALTRGKSFLASSVMQAYGKKFQTTAVTVTVRETSSVAVQDIDMIPKEFLREKVTISADKTAIGNAIKNGVVVPGAAIEKALSPTIK